MLLRTVVIDGGSGSGKTTLARRLGKLWSEQCGQQVQVVGLDSFYPGWFGLAEASRMVHQDVLRADSPGYRRWDWERNQPADWVVLDPQLPLLVEGCGALTPESAKLAGLTIWVELDAVTRKHRALARDGDSFAPWWDAWAEQDQAHWRANRPQELAMFRVDAAGLPGLRG